MARRIPRGFSPHAEGDGERDGPGEHWVTIEGNHVLIHKTQGRQPGQAQPELLTSKIVLGQKVVIIFDIRLSPHDKRIATEAITAATDLLNKNAAEFTADEKKAIGAISSFFVTASEEDYLGSTGNGTMTLSEDYIDDPGISAAWVGSLFGHEGQHYLNAGMYAGPDRWRDEQSASKTQLGIGGKIGFTSAETNHLREWMDDKNRAEMQKHMERGYQY